MNLDRQIEVSQSVYTVREMLEWGVRAMLSDWDRCTVLRSAAQMSKVERELAVEDGH